MYRKNIVYIRFVTIFGCRHPWRSRNISPVHTGELLLISDFHSFCSTLGLLHCYLNQIQNIIVITMKFQALRFNQLLQSTKSFLNSEAITQFSLIFSCWESTEGRTLSVERAHFLQFHQCHYSNC